MTKKARELKTVSDDKFSDIFKQTVDDMQALGTYKTEFSPAITRYSEMRVQFLILMDQWYAAGCKITEPYTNKNGSTNNRKTTLYQSIETLRAELTSMENLFGLTPAGLKKINDKSLATKKESILAKALQQIE
ncbi:MAG: P27 family phage terminase small subunit [Oscillospiraceae bacterium]|nr:P27 family phage terminase small subunit [Oscillospiraceae bacterium]